MKKKSESLLSHIVLLQLTGSSRFRGYHPDDILVVEHACVVDVFFSLPAFFIAWIEDLDGHLLPIPVTQPHLTKLSHAWEEEREEKGGDLIKARHQPKLQDRSQTP